MRFMTYVQKIGVKKDEIWIICK